MWNRWQIIRVISIIAVIYLLSTPSVCHAYTIGPADVTVSAYIGSTPVASPSPTLSTTPSPSMSPTPPVNSLTPTPTPTGGRFSIFGYTSPRATVSIQNPGMFIDTSADQTGYFEFAQFFSRLLVEDICLIAQDQLGRTSMPVCIPPMPDDQNSSIGPIIMPPTISINNDSFFAGDTITISGQTTPNSTINLSMFTDESKTSLQALLYDKEIPITNKIAYASLLLADKINLVPHSYAASLPKSKLKVDTAGNFSLPVSSDDPQYYRTFAQTIINTAFSPKSTTLNFDIFPGWFIFMKIFLGFLQSLKGRILEIILFSQLVIILYTILNHYLHPRVISRMRALVKLTHPLPMLTHHDLLIQHHELLLQKHELEKEFRALMKQ